MKTAKEILEEAKLHDTVWGQRIIAAEERNQFTLEDRRKALEWTTCACGEITSNIPRNVFGAPRDTRLFNLGMLFIGFVRIENPDFNGAAKTLVKIEERAIKVASKQ